MVNVISVFGNKNSGKSTLLKSLDPELHLGEELNKVKYNSIIQKELILMEFDEFNKMSLVSDCICYVTDLTLGFDQNLLNDILNLLSFIKNTNKMNIPLIIIINKCDLADYEFDDDGNMIWEESLNIKYNELIENITKLYNTIVNDNNLYFIKYMSELAFITLSIEKDIELEKSYIEKIGIFEHGKHKWKKLSGNNKKTVTREIIKQYKSSNKNIEQKVLSGYFELKNKLVNLESSNIDQKINVLMELPEKNETILKLIGELVRIYPIETNKIKFTSLLENNIYLIQMIDDQNIQNFELYLNYLNKIYSNYSDIVIENLYKELQQKICTKINDYYLKIINFNENDLMLDHIKKLQLYGYQDLNSVINKFLLNNLDKTLLFNNTQKIIDIYKNLLENNIISKNNLISLIFSLILEKIRYISSLNISNDYFIAYCHLLKNNLKKLYSLEYNNIYVQLKCALRNLLILLTFDRKNSFYIIDEKLIGDEKILFLENYLISLIQETQQNNISNNQSQVKKLEKIDKIDIDSDISDCEKEPKRSRSPVKKSAKKSKEEPIRKRSKSPVSKRSKSPIRKSTKSYSKKDESEEEDSDEDLSD